MMVRLTPKGRSTYRDDKMNPHGLTGEDKGPKGHDDRWPHFVEWENGQFNEYRAGEVEEVK